MRDRVLDAINEACPPSDHLRPLTAKPMRHFSAFDCSSYMQQLLISDFYSTLPVCLKASTELQILVKWCIYPPESPSNKHNPLLHFSALSGLVHLHEYERP